MAHTIAVTMRTPGHDFELAAGFLFAEGVVTHGEQIAAIDHARNDQGDPVCSIVRVTLKGIDFDPNRLSRHVFTSSSCGICGRIVIDQIVGDQRIRPALAPLPPSDLLLSLPARLRQAQTIFEQTGGLHASALFDAGGQLLLVREDVGRHNALDKLTGALLRDNRLPAENAILLVSGRASFELVQKAAYAGFATMVAIGAPSSMAVDLAARCNLNLIGFLKQDRFNVYLPPG